jgi:hypothetical protein
MCGCSVSRGEDKGIYSKLWIVRSLCWFAQPAPSAKRGGKRPEITGPPIMGSEVRFKITSFLGGLVRMLGRPLPSIWSGLGTGLQIW